MAIELKVPALGESISEVEIGDWKKSPGERVEKDEPIAILESEKATVELPSPASGTVTQLLKKKGETARVGEVIAYLDDEATAPAALPAAEADPKAKAPPAKVESPSAPRVMPAAERALAERGLRAEEVTPSGPGGRILKEDVIRHPAKESAAPTAESKPSEARPPAVPALTASKPTVQLEPLPEPTAESAEPEEGREEEKVPMTRLRRTVAERLVQAQHNAALLTTFNEIDMTSVMALRQDVGEAFQAKYSVKLGFMSFFVIAAVDALRLVPQVNAEIRGKDIVYYKYCDIGVAIGGGKGLVVPVLRHAEKLSFAEIELAIADFARRARENKLTLEELKGGTFTISNGGVYGSLLSTPIVNPPQSGVLGMHSIQERPVARQGQVVIRPMMYIALTYDHRLIDGREAVTFLRRIKDVVENPVRMLVEV